MKPYLHSKIGTFPNMMITLSPENREENISFLVKQGEVTGIKLASEITNKHR